MEQIVLILHVLAAIAVIALILFQQGKGADMGASMGAGASQTLFGSSGGGSVLTRATAILATIFFCTSLALAYVAKQRAGAGTDIIEVETQQLIEDVPALVETEGDEIPTLDIPAEEIPE